MKAFIVNRGKKYMGRTLAHDAVDALRKARSFWGPGLYKVSPVIVQQAVVAATAPGLDLNVGDEVTLEARHRRGAWRADAHAAQDQEEEVMSWYDEMPPANSPAAIDKVFELAHIPLGMMEVVDSDVWKAWLAEARKHVRFGNATTDQASKRRALLKKLRATGGPVRQRPCGVCGLVGHNRRSCPEATR